MPCIVDLATMREAVGRARRRSRQGQSAGPRRPGHRPLRHRRHLRHAPTPSSATSRSSTSATASATSSCAGARAPSTTSRWSRPAPASCIRSTSSTWPGSSWCATCRRNRRGRFGRLSRHLRGHRQPHHHGQRPGRARLGRWRYRGRGGDAGPAGVDADPPRRRLQADRRDQARRHRHRRGPDRHRDAAQARRGRQVRRVLRQRRSRGAAGQPRDAGQHEPRIRFHRSDLPDRRGDASTTCASPAAADEQVALVEAYAKAQGMWHDPAHEPTFSEYLELDLSTVVPSIAGPKRPQDRIELIGREDRVPQGHSQLRRGEPARPAHQARRSRRGVLPGQRSGRTVASPTTARSDVDVGRQRRRRAGPPSRSR